MVVGPGPLALKGAVRNVSLLVVPGRELPLSLRLIISDACTGLSESGGRAAMHPLAGTDCAKDSVPCDMSSHPFTEQYLASLGKSPP